MKQAHVDHQIIDAGLAIIPCKGKVATLKDWPNIKKLPKVEKGSNYGVCCGERNGIYVVDCDILKEKDDPSKFASGVEILKRMFSSREPDEWPDTPIVKTPTGGYHIYFKYEKERFHKQGTNLINIKIKEDDKWVLKKAKIDARSDNGYVLGPGSIHPDVHKRYTWMEGHSLEDFEPHPMPEYLEKALAGETNIVLVSESEFKSESRDIKKHVKTAELIDDDRDQAVPLDLLRQIVMGLSPTRADSRDDWMKVLFAIHTCTAGSNAGLVLAIEFSQQSSKFKGEDDVQSMMTQGRGSIKVGSLWFFLKQDNPDLFNALYKEHRAKIAADIHFRNYDSLAVRARYSTLTCAELLEFFKACIVKIDNYGTPLWMTKNSRFDDYTKEYHTYWELIGSNPFRGDNDMDFIYKKEVEGKMKEFKTSFSRMLKLEANMPGFPRHDRVDFIPYLHRKDVFYDEREVFNLFSGFAYDFDPDYKIDEAVLAPALEHMKNIICNGEDEVWEYMRKYFAHMFQRPFESPEVAIVISSIEGTGKTIFLKLVQKAMGRRLFTEFSKAADIVRKFNKQIEGKIMVVGYESKDYNDKLDMEKLKSMISDGVVSIEPKGVDAYSINYTARHFIICNSKSPLNIPLTERRICAIQIDDDKLRDLDFYSDLAKKFENPVLIKSFFHYFAGMDISGFNPRKFPETKFRKVMKTKSLPQPHRFIKDVLEERMELRGLCKQKSGIEVIPTKSLYNSFNDWRTENGETSSTTLNNFKEKLSVLNIEEETKRRQIDGHRVNCYVFDKDLWSKKLSGILAAEADSELDDE